MQQYWAKHEGRIRWGVKPSKDMDTAGDTYQSEAGHLYIWADDVRIDDGVLEFRSEDGQLKAAVAPGRWDAVYEASQDDTPTSVETK